MNTLPYQLIAFDMDDTLLNSNRTISPQNIHWIHKLRTQGVQIVLCSGRPTVSLLRTAKELLGENPGEYCISFNGGAISQVHNGQEISRLPLPSEPGMEILKIARNLGILLQAYEGDSFYVEKDDPRVHAYQKSINIGYEVLTDLSPIIQQGSLKLLMNGPREALLRAQEQLLPLANQGKVTMAFSKPEYLEFVHPQINKGTGLKLLCEHLGIPVGRTIGVGDSYNDRELILQAGLGVAVANAQNEIKEIADLVLESTNNQAIVQEIALKVFNLS